MRPILIKYFIAFIVAANTGISDARLSNNNNPRSTPSLSLNQNTPRYSGVRIVNNGSNRPSSNRSPYQNEAFVDTYGEMEETEQDPKEMIDAFLKREDRTTFIARVYAILSVQLLVLLSSIVGFGKMPGLKMWMIYKGSMVPILSLLISSVSVMVMSISEKYRRSSPHKWILLSLFTVCEAIAIGFVSSLYAPRTVMSALGATGLATTSVTLYTLLNRNPKRDLSQWGSSLFSLSMLFLAYSLISILAPNFLPFNEAVFSLLGAALFTVYLAYHTRLIISGKHSKYQLNEEDYVFGAMLLYDDITGMFLYLLRLLDSDDD